MRVAICIITYQRSSSLVRLLGSLQDLVLPRDVSDDDVCVVVVDNDAAESARHACVEANQWLRFPLHYAVEKRRGIPQARNAAIGLSLGRSDVIAFIDDDSLPSPVWIAELLRALNDFNADAVTGPSRARFDDPPPSWAEECGLFDVPEHANGTARDVANTGNVLVRTAAAASMPELFDENLALCGGSDSEFFMRFAAAGRRIVWAADAVVSECVQTSRVNLRWILQRGFRCGNSMAYTESKHHPGIETVARVFFHGVYCMSKGVGLFGISALRGRTEAVKALYLAAYGAGRATGLVGIRLNEYKTVHGE